MISRTDVLAHLERGMRAGFLKGQKAYQPLRSAFCEQVTSDGAYEIYGDLGAVPWPSQIGGQAPGTHTDSRTDAQQVGGLGGEGPITVLGGNERSMMVFNRDWGVPIGIWHSAINDNRVGGMERWARNAGTRFEQHMDYLAFDALNGGDGSSYGYAYDGGAFFQASHADPGAEYQTAQSNLNTTTLTLDNFETAMINASSLKDDRGQPAGFVYDLLVHSINLQRVAHQICNNPDDYGTANSVKNPYSGRVTPLTAPGGWFDSTAWVLICSNLPVKPLNLQLRQSPTLVYWDDHSQGTGIRYYKWLARYEVFYGDWRLAYMGKT